MAGARKAEPQPQPGRSRAVVALVAVVVLVVGGLVALRELTGPAGPSEAPDPASVDGSTAPGEVAVPTGEPPRAQPGATLRPIPEPVCTDRPIGGEVTVLGYNIKSGTLAGGLDAIGDVIAASGADILLLQEVDRFRPGSGGADQPAVLGARFGMEHSFGANVYYGGAAEYGTAILSAYPIVSTENTLLPNGPGGQQRGLLHTVVDVDGFELNLYNTHLQNEIDYLQKQQASRIAELLAPRGDEARILAGDMNNHPGSSELGTLRTVLSDTWDAVGSGAGLTHPSGSPRGRIDYLMHSGEGVSATGASVIPSTVSDHRPVRATYQLSGTERVCERPGQ